LDPGVWTSSKVALRVLGTFKQGKPNCPHKLTSNLQQRLILLLELSQIK
jgi:hypothetical protein